MSELSLVKNVRTFSKLEGFIVTHTPPISTLSLADSALNENSLRTVARVHCETKSNLNSSEAKTISHAVVKDHT